MNFLVLPLVPVFDDSGDHDIAYRRIFGLWAAGTAAKVGHVILGYYKWICEGSLKLPGAVRIMGRPGPGQILGYIVLWGIAVALLRCQRWGQTRKILQKIYKFDICSCNSAHSSIV